MADSSVAHSRAVKGVREEERFVEIAQAESAARVGAIRETNELDPGLC